MISFEDIRNSFQGRIELGESMARHMTFRIGGSADIYLEPNDKEDALALFTFLAEEEMPYVLIGNGSNVLIADEGIRAAVVNLEAGFNYFRFVDAEIIAGAGVKLAKFVDFCINNRCSGAEMLAGIPGTLGGAIIMNAGAYGGEISDYITKVDLIRSGKLLSINKEEGAFAYRTSGLVNDIVLEATFRFPEGVPEPMKVKRRELLIKRNASQPVNWPNAGSIFKNPPDDYAARLIEECGLKGRRVGGAQISELHANFIINVDNASANDVVELMVIAREAVIEKFNVRLEPEIKLIGFPEETIRRVNR
ncbi:MAG: UDP-N-acetylmuramate dehydrogenase [Candidatus Kapaibacterium sp.]